MNLNYTAMTEQSPDFGLPIEILVEIIRLLPLTDQQSLSLTCQLTRKLTLQSLFGHLKYTEKIPDKIRNIHQARADVKEAIKKLELTSNYPSNSDEPHIVFRFLETLPNLQSFKFYQCWHLIRPANISQLIASLRQAPLLELVLDTGFTTTVEGPLTTGLPGLKNLAIIWNKHDEHGQPGSARSQLAELIRPSLTTLVDLRIDEHLDTITGLDIQLLKPAGDTLRSFRYFAGRQDATIIDTIPVIFPHLTNLDLRWSRYTPIGHSVLWKHAHVNALAKNQNLTNLTLSSDFEVESDDKIKADDDYAWFVRCYKRRLKATQDIVSACEKLQTCTWIQNPAGFSNHAMEHPFVIEERVLVLSGGETLRVVRGVKQHWMGRDNEFWHTGEIVKCKLEDLPGEIIGENDPPSEDEL